MTVKQMTRRNMTVSVTVFSAAEPTFVPDAYLPISEGTTHFVDLIDLSCGESKVGTLIYLEGIFVPESNMFIFTDNAIRILSVHLNKAFKESAKMLSLLQSVVAANIIAASAEL